MNSRRLSFIVALFVLTSTFYLTLTILPEGVRATTLFVGGIGPGNYTTIQSAIDAANPGDTIYVYNRTYRENIWVNKTLSLLGEDRDTTTIDGSGSGAVVNITADWVNITAFTLLNSSAGIEVFSSNHTSIVGNNISDSRNGIVVEVSTNTTILDNNIQDSNHDGILFLDSRDGNIANNTFLSSGYSGIELANTHNFTIVSNVATDNRMGISLWQSNGDFVENNNLSLSAYHGIDLDESNNNVVSNNTLWYTGIKLTDSNNNTVVSNILSTNEQYIALSSSLNNTLLNNTIADGWIDISGMSLGHWNTHTIDTSNTVKGRPVYYLKNVVGGTVPTDAGEVLLANCTGMLVENLNLSNYGISFLVGFSSDSVITRNNFSLASLIGIYLRFSDNITIDENYFSVRASVDVEHSNNVTISNNEYLSSGGISAGSVSNLTVTNNVAPSGLFSLYSWSLNEANISNNVGSLGGTFEFYSCFDSTVFNNTFSDGGKIALQDSNNVTIARNILSHRDVGIALMYSDNSVVAENSISYESGWGIATYGSFNNTFVGNTVSHSPLGIRIRSSGNNTVLNNTISNNVKGILLNNTIRNLVKNNTFFWNAESDIYLEDSCYNNTIVNNTVSSSNPYGIHLSKSQDNKITNNSISNGVYGIYLSTSEGNEIDNNTIAGAEYGIHIGSNYNLVVNNTVSGNDNGVILSGSAVNNRVYHNRFIDNTIQAVNLSNNNYWDDGYPSGGNYWSDYPGIDLRNGPNQDQIGSDGIGDTPYDINQWTQDRYPLMTPFEMVHPLPPTVLDAHLSGNALENVTISWHPSLDDGKGLESVIGYEIYRSTTYDPSGLGYVSVASLPNGTSEFTDTQAGEGDPSNYFYRVCAVDPDNKRACARDQAGKFTRSLVEGTHLVSIPLIQTNESVESVLETLRFDKVRAYDTHVSKWNWYMTFKPYEGQLRSIDHRVGVWVNVATESNLTVAGVVPTNTSIPLSVGWNLIGFPSFNSTYAVSELKVAVNSTRVEGFDLLSAPYHLRALGDTEVLQPGYGYWVWVDEGTVLTINTQ